MNIRHVEQIADQLVVCTYEKSRLRSRESSPYHNEYFEENLLMMMEHLINKNRIPVRLTANRAQVIRDNF